MTAKIDSDKIELQRVQMLQGGIKTTKEFRKSIVKPESFDFSLDHEFFINPDEKLLVVELRIAFKGTKATEEETNAVGHSANYDYQFFFKIENIMDFLDDKRVVHPSIVSTVLSIEYSTLRGIILKGHQVPYLVL